jgi:hypothetical protein
LHDFSFFYVEIHHVRNMNMQLMNFFLSTHYKSHKILEEKEHEPEKKL